MPFKAALAAMVALSGQGSTPDRLISVAGCGVAVASYVRIPGEPERERGEDPAACHLAAGCERRRPAASRRR